MAVVRGPLPQHEFEQIFSRVPRLTVEVVIADPQRGVLLTLRESGPCAGLWHIPGGTVRFGEPAVEAVARVARDELGITVTAGELLGYIEYPSHYENGLDHPIGLAFQALTDTTAIDPPALNSPARWFTELPAQIHDEQREFLSARLPNLAVQRRAEETVDGLER